MSNYDPGKPWRVWRWTYGGAVVQVVSAHRWRWVARVWAGVLSSRDPMPGVAYLVKPRDDRASR
jgi:poly(3-hydroxybutyrate) depolymerase